MKAHINHTRAVRLANGELAVGTELTTALSATDAALGCGVG